MRRRPGAILDQMASSSDSSLARRILRKHLIPAGNDLREGPGAPRPRTSPSTDDAPGTDGRRDAPGPRSRRAEGAEGGADQKPGGPPRKSLIARLDRWLDRAVAGRAWWIRAPLLPVLAWVAWKHSRDIWYGSLFDGLNLAFHEIGHVFFSFFGSEFLTIAGGTIFELCIPLVAALYLVLRQRDPFGAGVCVFWAGTACASVGRYVYDTRSQIAGRVSIGPSSGPDDWTYLLSRFDLVRQDRVIGMGVKETGVAVMTVALVWCVFVLWKMALHDGERAR